MAQNPRSWRTGPGLSVVLVFGLLQLTISSPAGAGAYIFAGEANGVDLVTHPTGYTGSGGTLAVSVCIAPNSANAADMEISVRNIIHTWNSQASVTGNLLLGGANDIPSNGIDFESVALHELGHCIGLSHPNLASESGLDDPEANGTKSTDGVDGTFDVASGTDGVFGSSDDQRNDDINLHWFRISNNNPFSIGSPVDSTTYSRDLADLPGGHSYATNGDRTVSGLLGVPNTESVMQQLTFTDEDQRQLTHDDVATLQYAMSGLDETAANSDDYALELSYGGLSSSCDVVLDFDNAQTGFALCETSGSFISGGGHVEITSANIYFNTGFNWHFNDEFAGSLAATFQEAETGGVNNSTSVASGTLTAEDGHLYLASISTRPERSVSSVSGLGLTWTEVDSQCSGGGQTGVSVWQALGSPTSDGAVTANLSSAADRAVIGVTRYSEVRGAGAVSSVVAGNVNGVNGACSGGANSSSYSFDVTTANDDSRVFGAVATKHRTHTSGSGYSERLEVRQGVGNKSAGVAVEDRSVASPSSVPVDGSFNASVDWAFVGLEIASAECVVDTDCDDGLFCNGSETCAAGSCGAGSAVTCDDSVACTLDACNEATDVCDFIPNHGLCDDTLFCNGAETCDAVLGCQSGTAVTCDDSVACTLDACNEATDVCDFTPNHGLCDDTLFCNGAETCDAVLGCQPGLPVPCGDGVSCTVDTCNETTDQCDSTPDDGLCDDADPCTTNSCDPLLDCQSEPSGECMPEVPASGPWHLIALGLLLLCTGTLLIGTARRPRA